MKTEDIEIAVINYCLKEVNHEIVVPRCTAVGFEADILSVTKTAFLHEFEIKISKSDFNNDKHKNKWQWYEGVNKYCPNYFWYVCPEDLIKLDEIKDYQGLAYVVKGKLEIIKSPKRIMSKKCNMRIYRSMIRSLTHKLLNEINKKRTYQKEATILREKL
jgi:hypothetical protein